MARQGLVGRGRRDRDRKVDDATRRVTEAWTGPQVAWKMARGYAGAFGGKTINRPVVWLTLCARSSCSGSSTGAGP